jgi:uncharacterized protein YcbK (DUF882 family)
MRAGMRVRRSALVAGLAVLFSALVLAPEASADVRHVVSRGHTVDAISRRYHVPVKAILDANHIKDARHLKVGEVLVIPGVQPAPGAKTGPAAAKGAPAQPKKPAPPPTYAAKAKAPGVLHLSRLATAEDQTLRVRDRRGRMPPTAAKGMEHLLRYPDNRSHPIDARLIALLGIVSDHFGGRKIEIISGFRPYTPTQYTPHSNHNQGKAVDFRVVGVPNEVVRDFCRTLKNVGVGYYPNSVFVHMDVRTSPAFWIDYSKPGEPPHYNAPNLQPDEGASDVGNEAHVAAPTEADGSNPTPPPSEPTEGNPADP